MKYFILLLLALLSNNAFSHNNDFNPKKIHKCGVYGSGIPFDVVNIGQECVAPKQPAHQDATSCLSPVSTVTFPVANYGAIANDNIDDSLAIQATIDAADSYNKAVTPNRTSTVTLPAGTFKVSPNVIYLKSNISFKMDSLTILELQPTNLMSYQILRVPTGVTNVNILNGTIKGDRVNHIVLDPANPGEYGHGITLANSFAVNIENVKLINNWGDGLYVGNNSSYTRLCKSTIENNRRNGISITSANEVIIKNNLVKNNNGTSPQVGIDLEPNLGETLSKVTVADNSILDQLGSGISAGFEDSASGYDSSQIALENNYLKGNRIGVVLSKQNALIAANNFIIDSKEEGFYVYTGTKNSQLIYNTILNSGQSTQSQEGIGIYLEYSNGNEINNNTIKNSYRVAIANFLGTNTFHSNVKVPDQTIPAGLQ